MLTFSAMYGLSNNRGQLLIPHIGLSASSTRFECINLLIIFQALVLCFHFGICASWINNWWQSNQPVDGDLLILAVAAVLFEAMLLSAMFLEARCYRQMNQCASRDLHVPIAQIGYYGGVAMEIRALNLQMSVKRSRH